MYVQRLEAPVKRTAATWRMDSTKNLLQDADFWSMQHLTQQDAPQGKQEVFDAAHLYTVEALEKLASAGNWQAVAVLEGPSRVMAAALEQSHPEIAEHIRSLLDEGSRALLSKARDKDAEPISAKQAQALEDTGSGPNARGAGLVANRKLEDALKARSAAASKAPLRWLSAERPTISRELGAGAAELELTTDDAESDWDDNTTTAPVSVSSQQRTPRGLRGMAGQKFLGADGRSPRSGILAVRLGDNADQRPDSTTHISLSTLPGERIGAFAIPENEPEGPNVFNNFVDQVNSFLSPRSAAAAARN
jgi:hypothetical protein